ncbi:hypothetical protein LTR27_004921 [Elasticomyces elasticus]|nr:hypothetical protein LTR27_004921 [Elasticomyces elasticus]
MSYTDNPRHSNNPSSEYKNENPGTVTSDSLAGESIQGGGSFGANSDARGPMGQSSQGTNTNNTDTSGATELPASRNRGDRDEESSGNTYDLSSSSDGRSGGSGSSGQQRSQQSNTESYGGSGNTGGGEDSSYSSGNAGGNSSSSYSDENSNPNSSSSSGGSSGSSSGGYGRPHGTNITEDPSLGDDQNNASFDTDIGGKNDPGREALQDMAARTARGAGGEGARQYGQAGGSNQGGFERLGDDASS